MTGVHTASYMFAGRTYTAAGKGDVWVGKLDPWGRPLWVHMWGGAEPDEGRAVAADADSVYVAGHFQSPTLAMGAFTLRGSHVNTTDIFLARLNGTTGEVLWARAFGTEAVETVASLAVAPNSSGSVLLAGVFAGPSLALDASTTLTNANAPAGNSSFLATFGAADGSVLSATAYADMPWVSRMVRDASTGAVYFIGTDYVSRLGSWRASLGQSSVADTRRSIAVDPTSRFVFVAGQYTSATITLGSTTLRNGNNNGGSPDAYVARLDAATGAFHWAQRLVGGGQEVVLGLAVDSSNVYAAGT